MHATAVSSSTLAAIQRTPPRPHRTSTGGPDVALSTAAALQLQVVIHIPTTTSPLALSPSRAPEFVLPNALGQIVLEYLDEWDGDLGKLEQLCKSWPPIAQAVSDYRGAMLYLSPEMKRLAERLHSTVQVEEVMSRVHSKGPLVASVFEEKVVARRELAELESASIAGDTVSMERIDALKARVDQLNGNFEELTRGYNSPALQTNLKGFLGSDKPEMAIEREKAEHALLKLFKAHAEGITDEQWLLFMLVDEMEQTLAGRALKKKSEEEQEPAMAVPVGMEPLVTAAFNVSPCTPPLPQIFGKKQLEQSNLKSLKKMMALETTFGLAHWFVMRHRAYTYALHPGEAAAMQRMSAAAAQALN